MSDEISDEGRQRGLKLFIDTMIFLHFKQLPELKLHELFGVDEITIVVPTVTIRELDKHKTTHSSSKVKERAKKAIHAIDARQFAADLPIELFMVSPDAE